MKNCFKCGNAKPLECFYKHPQMADGHLNKCKECTKNDVRAHRYSESREKILQYDRLRANNPKRKEKRKTIISNWVKKHPEKVSAQQKLRRAIKSGLIIKWPVCALPECDKKPEAHHPDYSRPLDVVWLCTAHHRQTHALMRFYKEQS